MLLRRALLSSFVVVAACSGGGGSGSSASTGDQAGSVAVVLDTRAGDDSFVQFLVAGAALADDAGRLTRELLGSTQEVTFDDPSGEPAGLRLRGVPAGTYRSLHLVLVPGSGVRCDASGVTLPVTGPVELVVPLAAGLVHDGVRASWIVVGHDAAPFAGGNDWRPSLSGRIDGEPLAMEDLRLAVTNDAGLVATAGLAGDTLLQVVAAPGCAYESEDDQPGGGAFFGSVSVDDDLQAWGSLTSDGRLRVDRLRRASRNDRARLIGRITSIDGALRRFEMSVQATARRGSRELLPTPEAATVLADTARIEGSNGQTIPFAELQVGRLVKVQWLSRTVEPGGNPVYVAREVELRSGSATSPSPQWEGRVAAVDLVAGSLRVEPRGDDPLWFEGQSVASLTVMVESDTVIVRKATQGGGETAISLADVVPGVDRVWIRGAVVGPTTVRADRLRVRAE